MYSRLFHRIARYKGQPPKTPLMADRQFLATKRCRHWRRMLELNDEIQVGMSMRQIVACQSANDQEYLPYLWADRRNKALPTLYPGPRESRGKAATLGNLCGFCASAVQVPTPTQQTESQCCCRLQAAVGCAISSDVRAPLVHTATYNPDCQGCVQSDQIRPSELNRVVTKS
jgi:hypothetical protein